jgi:methoxymalonate biosynthesis protein
MRHRLAIVGAGVMGTGIATLALGRGVPVVLVDTDPAKVEQASSAINQQLRHAQLLKAFSGDRSLGELITTTSIGEAGDATAVIEAVTEDPGIKAKVLAEVSETMAYDTLLISNTSGIPIDEMAAHVALPDMLVGIHFMNPSYLIKTVEVSRGPRTGDLAMKKVSSLLAALDRKAIVVKDTPGFVTSRLLHPMINDAARIVSDGTASVAEVDALMQGCLGHPTGPLRTGDLIGLDNLADSLNVLLERTGDERYRPCELLLEKVRAGDLGRKTGHGFYDYGRDGDDHRA